MLTEFYKHLQINYLDVADPERSMLKICIRTTIACLICMIIFQVKGYPVLSSWAGFAGFSFLLNDNIQLSTMRRFLWLVGVVLLFTAMVTVGMVLSNHQFYFLLSIPIITFLAAYSACLGMVYFVLSGWLLFLYVFAGSTPVQDPVPIVLTFLISGAICVLAAFLIYPINAKKQVKNSILFILNKYILYLHQPLPAYEVQIDQGFVLLENNINYLNDTSHLPQKTQLILVNLSSLLEQINLLLRSITTYEFIDQESKLVRDNACRNIKSLIVQVNQKIIVDLSEHDHELDDYRNFIHEARKQEIAKANPSFDLILVRSNYFYHFVMIAQLTKTASQEIAKLQEVGLC